VVGSSPRGPFDPAAPNDAAVEAAFEAVPDTMVGEIVDGELYTSPRPARPHTNARSVLIGELYTPFRRDGGDPRGWVILVEPELHLGPKPDTLEAYRLEESRWVLLDTYEADALVRAPPFEAFELALGRLWAR
jgi:hypothetical protein